MIRSACSICNSTIKNIYSLENMPVKLLCQDIVDSSRNKLSFSQCETCNTIQLDNLIPLDFLYSESHNIDSVGVTWSNYFNFFSIYIKEFIINKNVLEIGDPSAKIAKLSNNYNKWIIVEPTKNKNRSLNEKIIYIESFFDEKLELDYKVDIIIHSLLFEHLYDFNSFLTKCYDLLDFNGSMIFCIPNMEYIAMNNLAPFLGIFFEHTVFLNKENVAYILKNSGFEIIKQLDYLKHSILFNVKKCYPISEENIKIVDYKANFFKSLERYSNFAEKCNKIINDNINKKCFLFGASYNTQFLLELGLNKENLSGLLDNSVFKQDKYFYGYNLKIFSPSILKTMDCIVILNNGYYNDEIEKQIIEINSNTFIIKNCY